MKVVGIASQSIMLEILHWTEQCFQAVPSASALSCGVVLVEVPHLSTQTRHIETWCVQRCADAVSGPRHECFVVRVAAIHDRHIRFTVASRPCPSRNARCCATISSSCQQVNFVTSSLANWCFTISISFFLMKFDLVVGCPRVSVIAEVSGQWCVFVWFWVLQMVVVGRCVMLAACNGALSNTRVPQNSASFHHASQPQPFNARYGPTVRRSTSRFYSCLPIKRYCLDPQSRLYRRWGSSVKFIYSR